MNDDQLEDELRRVFASRELTIDPEGDAGVSLRREITGVASFAVPSPNAEPDRASPTTQLGNDGGVHREQPSRLRPVLAFAAAVAVLVGAAVWIGVRDESTPIRTTDGAPTATTEPDAASGAETPAGEAVASEETWLLPNASEWAISEAFPTQSSEPTVKGGVWAWRIDGVVYVLVDEVALADLGPFDQAPVEISEGRTMIAWVDGEHRLGLQGYGVSEQTLRSVAARIEETPTGWSVPGAELLVGQPDGPSELTSSIQVGYSPLDAEGIADLSTVITGIYRSGTAGDMYRELFEASSLGAVKEISIAGLDGFRISGQFASHAIVFGDGIVSTWSTTDPETDLAALLSSIEAVSVQEWDEAVADVDQVVSEAIGAVLDDATAASPTGIDALDPANDPDLPRYLLPEPWQFDFVTDAGLWSADDRAQREALFAANAQPSNSLLWTQGFRTAGATLDPDGLLPFAIPDTVISVFEREDDGPLNLDATAEPLSFAGLDGYILTSEVFDDDATDQLRTEFSIVGTQGRLLVGIEAPFNTEEQLREFASTLTVNQAGLSQGLVSDSPVVRLLLEAPGDAGERAGLYGRWLAAFKASTTTREDVPSEVRLQVKSASFEQLQLEIVHLTTRGGLTYAPVTGTNYLAAQYQQNEEFVVGDDGELVDGPGAVERTNVLRYDPETHVLVTLDVDGDLPSAIALFEELVETDLGTWRERVTPFNAQPLNPR